MSKQEELVPFYDSKTNSIINIPSSELAPGCCLIQLADHPGQPVVWAESEFIKIGKEPVHPPFSEELRKYIRYIHESLDPVYSMSFEEWEMGFRKDMNPTTEIASWIYAVDVFNELTKKEKDITKKRHIFFVLVACMNSNKENVHHVIDKNVNLSNEEIETIINTYYSD